MRDFLRDYNSWCTSAIYSLAIGCIWYGLEYVQFSKLQWDRKCDNCVYLIYYILIAWLVHKNNIK